MTAPDEKARQYQREVEKLYDALFRTFSAETDQHTGETLLVTKPYAALDAITAALIEARRAALEEAALIAASAKVEGDLRSHTDGTDRHNSACDEIASCIRALIPTRPDGAAEGAEK